VGEDRGPREQLLAQWLRYAAQAFSGRGSEEIEFVD